MAIADHPNTTDTDQMRVPLRRVAVLHQIGERLMQAADENLVLRFAAQQLVRDAGYATAWIAVLDCDHGVLRGCAGAGIPQAQVTRTVAISDAQEIAELVLTGAPVIVPDAVRHAEAEGWGDLAREKAINALLFVPYGPQPEVTGVIVVATVEHMHPQEEITLLEMFAAQLSTALNKQRYDAERAQQIAALEAAAQTHEQLLQTVRDLSTPAIPIYDGILAIPLVGNIDSGRASQVMETVLTSIQRVHAAVVILDVTGVPVIDTGVANHLVQVTQAAQLLGAKCLLVGIKPEVAQTLVQLGVDLSSIATRSDLQAGMAFALAQRGLRIVESRN
jgi:anti-anti-sigma regulatory factor